MAAEFLLMAVLWVTNFCQNLGGLTTSHMNLDSSSLSGRSRCSPVYNGILMDMKRTFKTVNYEQALDLTVRLGDCLPPEHLARFVVDSVALLDVSALYAHYGSRGGEPYAPEVLLGLLF